MLKKVIFSLLLICLLALPGSAWEMTFEDHSNDVIRNSQIGTMFSGYSSSSLSTTIEGNSMLAVGGNSNVNITGDWDDYFAFTYTSSSSQTVWATVTLKDENGTTLCTTGAMYAPCASGSYKRVEIVKSSVGVIAYVNGVQFYSGSVADKEVAYTVVQFTQGGTTNGLLDDFTTDYYSIGVESSFTPEDGTEFVTYGVPIPSSYNTWLRLCAPNGTILYTWNLTGSGAGYLTWNSDNNLSSAGTYAFRLVGKDTIYPTSQNFTLETKTFTYIVPSANSIETDKAAYNIGDKIYMYLHVAPYSSGYKVHLTANGNLLKSFDVTAEDNTFTYTIPSNIGTNYLFAYLVNPEGDIDDSVQVKINGMESTPYLEINKDVYSNNETIYVYYYHMPIGTKLTATFYSGSNTVRSSTVTLNDVVSYSTFTIGGSSADYVLIEAYDPDTDEVYDSVSATILKGTYRISGKVYNAESGTPISGATVLSEGFSATTNSLGEYSGSTFPGDNTISVSATGYEDLHVATYVNSVNFVQNFYLVPLYVSDSGSSLYGSVTDYYTGDPVANARLLLRNGTTSYTKYSDSRGYYYFDNAALVGDWTISVTADDYDNYQRTVTISGDTYLGIRLVPEGGIPDAEEVEPQPEVDYTNYSAQPYGAMGRHPFDFNGDGDASADEWKYAFERLIILVGCLCFMGFLGIVGRAGRR
ncbi:MAG: hypothetical protein QG646_3255 [Euryarchaeota archaeon]|nr:hypothetical protein [Euryarchaeota archaeon]